MHRWTGRVALVTGASAGIGAQVAADLVRAGMQVVAVARRLDKLTELASSLAGERGRLHPLQADLSLVEEVRRVYRWLDDNLGALAVVVNNVGVSTSSPVQDMDAAAIQRVINTNLTGLVVSCSEAVGSMKKHGVKDGHIINVNSVAGHVQIPSSRTSVSVYSTTKHAVTAFCRGLRCDLRELPDFNIRVTSLSPGTVLTDMTKAHRHAAPPNQVLSTKDVSDAVLYALSCPPSVLVTELTLQPVGERF